MRALPKTVGRYRVIAKLGQGGMATALLALSEGPGGFRKLSVVKQLRLDLCEDPEFVAMFLDEARIAALLNHPNVVQTNEVGAEGNIRFISMEYLQGQSLARVLYRVQGRLPLAMHIRVIVDALTGLHYVHELADLSGKQLEVVHRDVSPGNIFVTYDGAVKVLDFGIAKAEGSRAVTEVGSFKGKMAYVAPEQARAAAVDRRADVFSMGVLLWEALARRPLVFREEADIISLQNRVKGLEPSIDELAPETPLALRQVCKKAMALNPKDRYSTAEEYRDALQEAALGLPNGSQKDLATVMTKLFKEEREAIAATIAKTISTKDPFKSDVEMISSWEASTSMSNQKLILEDAITQELTKGDYSVVESGSKSEPHSRSQPYGLAEAPSQSEPHSRSESYGLVEAPSQSEPYSRSQPYALAEAPSQSEPYSPSEPYYLVETPSEVEVSSLASTVLPRTIFAKKASYRNAALSIVALSLVIGLAAYFTGTQESAATSPEMATLGEGDSDTAGVTETTPNQAPGAAMIQVQIEVRPKTTTLMIDGENLASNPYSASRALSGEVHELVASAPGYKTSRREIRLDSDLKLRFALDEDDAAEIEIEAMEVQTGGDAASEKAREGQAGRNKRENKKDKEDAREARVRNERSRDAKTRAEDKDTATLEVDKEANASGDKKSASPGDALRRKRDQQTRKIDKDNPYN